MTAALEGGEWSAARPGCTLPSGKTRYPLYGRLGGPQDRSGRAENLAPQGFDRRTVQPVVSRYTDWATRPTQKMLIHRNCYIWFCGTPTKNWRTSGVHASVILSGGGTGSLTVPLDRVIVVCGGHWKAVIMWPVYIFRENRKTVNILGENC